MIDHISNFFMRPLGVFLQGARLLLTILLLAVTVSGISADTATSSLEGETWQAANQAYSEGNFDHAAELYERLLDEGVRKVPLWYNLGTTYARLDRPYRASWLLRRALTYDPAHRGARANLQLIAEELGEADGGVSSVLRVIETRIGSSVAQWLGFGAPQYWMIATLALLLVGGALHGLGRRRQAQRVRRTGFALGVAGLLALALIFYHDWRLEHQAAGTLLADVKAWSGPDDQRFTSLAEIEAGEIVTLASREVRNGFAEIVLPNGQAAFVRLDAIGPHRVGYLPEPDLHLAL